MNFVFDNTHLPIGKTDRNALPEVPAGQKVTASEWNTAMQASLDLRGALLAHLGPSFTFAPIAHVQGLVFTFAGPDSQCGLPDGGCTLVAIDQPSDLALTGTAFGTWASASLLVLQNVGAGTLTIPHGSSGVFFTDGQEFALRPGAMAFFAHAPGQGGPLVELAQSEAPPLVESAFAGDVVSETSQFWIGQRAISSTFEVLVDPNADVTIATSPIIVANGLSRVGRCLLVFRGPGGHSVTLTAGPNPGQAMAFVKGEASVTFHSGDSIEFALLGDGVWREVSRSVAA